MSSPVRWDGSLVTGYAGEARGRINVQRRLAMKTNTCEAIKHHVAIEQIIGQVVPLRRHRHWWIGRCPFHADRHPSLVVWPATQTWKCMTCSPIRDDVIGFVQRWRHCSTADALQWLRTAAAIPDGPVPRPVPIPTVPIADPAARHATYTALLAAWGLSSADRAALRARGLTDAQIRRAGLASAHPGPAPVPPVSEGIPGFFRVAGQWHVGGPAGLAIPVRDPAGQILALHLRTAQPAGRRYRWFSTPADRRGGAPSGAPAHVARGIGDVVWITEGPLKALVAQAFLRHTVIGVPGVSAWSTALPIIQALRPKRLVVAFDVDAAAATRAVVQSHQDALIAALTVAGYPVLQAQWHGPKGLDDALLAKVPVTFVRRG